MQLCVVLAGFLRDVSVNPTTSGLPGSGFLQQVLDWAAQLALWGSLAAMLAGAAIYGMAQHSGNLSGASRGKTLAVAGLIGAALTGVAPTAVNLLYHAAGS